MPIESTSTTEDAIEITVEDIVDDLTDNVASVTVGERDSDADESVDEAEDSDKEADENDDDGSDNLSLASTETYVSCRQHSISDADGATEEDLEHLEAVVELIDDCAVTMDYSQRQYDELVKFALRSDANTRIRAHASLIAQRDCLYEKLYENWEVTGLLDVSVSFHSYY